MQFTVSVSVTSPTYTPECLCPDLPFSCDKVMGQKVLFLAKSIFQFQYLNTRIFVYFITFVLQEIWITMLHHVVDEHVWALYGGKTDGRCAHEQLDEEERKKPWLKKNSPAHYALRKIIMDKCLLNTLKYYTNFRFVYPSIM